MMKNLGFLSLSLLVFILSCQKKDSTGPAGSLSVSRTAIRLDTALSYSDTFTVHSTVAWTAAISPASSWLQLNKTSGAKGDTVLTVTVLSNKGSATTQSATIILSAVNNSQIHPVTITLTQKPYTISLGWQKLFGGTGDDEPSAIAKTADGGSILAGYAYSIDGDVTGNHASLTSDFWVVKLDASGNKQWARTYGGTSYDAANSIIATADGGYAVAGYTYSTDGDVVGNHGNYDFWVLKLDGSGNIVWAKTFGGTSDDEATSIVATKDGGFAVTGYTASTDGDVVGNHGSYDVWLVKLNGSGNILWTKTFGGSSDEYSNSIVTTADGGYAVTGYTTSTDGDVTGNHGGNDIWLVKLDGSGNKQWAKTFGGTKDEYTGAVITAPNGGYTIVGYTSSTDGDVTNYYGSYDMWVVKADANGNKLWAKSFGGSGSDYAVSAVATSDGGYMIVGGTYSTDGDVVGNHGNGDLWMVKLDGSSHKQWAKTLGGTGSDYAAGIVTATDGSFTVVASTFSNDGDVTGNHGSSDFWALKVAAQ